MHERLVQIHDEADSAHVLVSDGGQQVLGGGLGGREGGRRGRRVGRHGGGRGGAGVMAPADTAEERTQEAAAGLSQPAGRQLTWGEVNMGSDGHHEGTRAADMVQGAQECHMGSGGQIRGVNGVRGGSGVIGGLAR